MERGIGLYIGNPFIGEHSAALRSVLAMDVRQIGNSTLFTLLTASVGADPVNG